ncbi:MAG: FIVAR domain-containing protein [Treponema sp.]|jgi:CO dehydrogenase/acetyl-CoA synthase epsilon subunit|nr:FIVAR domain-containing protein [Treponema sp.]
MVKKRLLFGCVVAAATLLLLTGCPTSSSDDEEPVNEERVDKTALNAAIDAAEQVVAAIPVDTDGARVSSAYKWVSQADKDAYEAAISAAKAVAAKADASQVEIDDALAALKKAATVFDAAKQVGTGVNPSALTAAISAAEQAAEAIKVDTDGTSTASVYEWVSQTVKDDYTTAISTARAAAAKADASQAEIDDALAALNTATTTFANAKQKGTKTVNTDDLNSEISAAEAAVVEVKEDTDGSKISLEEEWVSKAVKDAYTAAINTAKAAAAKDGVSQAEIEAALTALVQAGATFNQAKQAGTLVSKDGLKEAIEAADEAVKAVTVNTSAANVAVGKYWVEQDAMNAYTDAIKTAKTTADNAHATLKDVERALAALNKATKAFEDAKAEGINKPVHPEIVFDTTVILYHGTTPLSREKVTEVALNSSYEVKLAQGYGYTNIHWYINGTKQGFPDTMSTLLLPTGTARWFVVSVEATSDGRVDTSGNYTFEVK